MTQIRIAAGYFLLSATQVNQEIYRNQLKQVCPLKVLISTDEKVGGILPNLFGSPESFSVTSGLLERCLDTLLIPNVFGTFDDAFAAFRIAQHFLDDLCMIGVSLEEELVADFHEFRGDVNDAAGKEGVPFMIDERQPLHPGGRVIGFDIAGYEVCYFTSYLKNHLFEEYQAHYPNVTVNPYGLFDEPSAKALAALTNDTLIEEAGAEDLMWLPWGITLYREYKQGSETVY